MPKSCCAVGCTNHNMLHPLTVSFHLFPIKNPERFNRWVNAVKRVNEDGSAWRPGKHAVLCSAHFVTGKPSKDPTHPDYVPSVFHHNQTESMQKGKKSLSRYLTAAKRKITFETPAPKRAALQEVTENSCSTVPDLTGCPVMVSHFETPVRKLLEPVSTEATASTSDVPTPCTPLVDMPSNVCTPAEQAFIETPASVPYTRPMEDPERRALYDELYRLREEVSGLKDTLDRVKLSASCIEGDDERSKFHTGLSWDVFITIFTYLSTFVKPGAGGTKMNLRDQFFITLLKLRLDIPFEFIAIHCGMGLSTVSDTFWRWIDLMYVKLGFLVHWPDRETIKQTLPSVFKNKFPRLTSIIDCFEIFIERPRNLKARAKTWSNYKKSNTIKVFCVCSPLGSVTFISSAWGGRVSDVELVRKCGFIDPCYHHPGDQILADRGFLLQDDFAIVCGAELIIPAFTKGKSQLSAQEVEISRQMSSVRIHIERIIGLVKNRFTILQNRMPIQLIKCLTDEVDEKARVDKLLHVCASLTNLGEGVVYSEN